jgi:predicted transport protein
MGKGDGVNVITIENDGQRIISTNYWQSEYARKNIVFLSVNSGMLRLLLPINFERDISEMKTGKDVIVSIGTLSGVEKSYEILFDDHTDNPYCLHFGNAQADRVPNKDDGGRADLRLLIYTKKKFEETLQPDHIFENVKLRFVKTLPCMKPWSKK